MEEINYYNYKIKVLTASNIMRFEAVKISTDIKISFLHEKIMEIYLGKIYDKSNIDFAYRTLLDFSKNKIFLNKEQLMFIEKEIAKAKTNIKEDSDKFKIEFQNIFSGFHQDLYTILYNLKNNNTKDYLSSVIPKLENLKHMDYESAIQKRTFSFSVRSVRQI